MPFQNNEDTVGEITEEVPEGQTEKQAIKNTYKNDNNASQQISPNDPNSDIDLTHNKSKNNTQSNGFDVSESLGFSEESQNLKDNKTDLGLSSTPKETMAASNNGTTIGQSNNSEIEHYKENSTHDIDNFSMTTKSNELNKNDNQESLPQSQSENPNLVAQDSKNTEKNGENQKPGNCESKVIVNKQSFSLQSLSMYDGDSDSDDTEVAQQTSVKKVSSDENSNAKKSSVKESWRNSFEDSSGTSDSESDSSESTLSSDSETEDSDSGSVIDISDDGVRGGTPVLLKNSEKGAVKKQNSNIYDLDVVLPPLPDLSKLNINVEKEEFMHMGHVKDIIVDLVTIEAIPGTPAFDLDSMLFTDDQTSKKPIGPIYDVLGPVSEPIYCVRYNSEDDVKKLGLKSGMKVYAAPKNDEFTKFVFLRELMKLKGTDASWLNDQEQPPEMEEFSDDEKEREAKRGAKKALGKRKLDDGSLERHKRYERTMNKCNTLNTRVCRFMDAHTNIPGQIRPNRGQMGFMNLPSVPPMFNPAVPPPGFMPQLTPPPPVFGQNPSFNSAPGAPSSFGGSGYSAPAMPPNWNWTWNYNGSNSSDGTNHQNTRGGGGGEGPSSQPF